MRLPQWMLTGLLVIGLFSCGHKTRKTGNAEKPVDLKDFMGTFRELAPPVQFGDSSLVHKPSDSAIALGVLAQFLPDSVFQTQMKGFKGRYFASGKVVVKKAESYLFLKLLSAGRKSLYVLVFDKAGKFSALKALVVGGEDVPASYFASLDAKYTLTVQREHKESGNRVYQKSVYVYNSDAGFMLIMKEGNEEKRGPAAVYNPIDTLPRKHRFSGDYVTDKQNFISVRDGRNNGIVRFFVHFEKDKGECKGELKGEAKLVAPNVARYSASGDPCSVSFSFTDRNVTMKELEGCGNHRDIRCYFEGVYAKKKETRPKAPVKSGKPESRPKTKSGGKIK